MGDDAEEMISFSPLFSLSWSFARGRRSVLQCAHAITVNRVESMNFFFFCWKSENGENEG